MTDATRKESMTAVTPGSRPKEVRHAVARIIDPNCWWDSVPPNDHQQRKCNRALAKADEIIARLAAKPADPDAMNEKRAAEDAKLASNVREATVEECAKILDACAQDWNRIRDPGMANNARAYATKIRALSTTGAPKP